MVAIVSGSSPGLELGSRAVLGADGMAGRAGLGRDGQGVHVNVANGLLVIQVQDDLHVGRGIDAATVRTYNSAGTFNDDNGDNWSSNVVSLRLAGALNTAGSSMQRVAGDGSTASYVFDAARSLYVTSEGAGAHDTIAWVGAAGQFEWREGGTGVVERFEGSGALRLLSRRDASGAGVTFAYGAGGFLSKVTTSNGETVHYDYSGGNLMQVRSVAGSTEVTRVRYGYDTSNRLASVTVDLTPGDNSIADGQVYRTSYTYEGSSKRIASIVHADGSSVAFAYVDTGGGQYKLATVTNALGQATSFAYGNGFTTVTDAQGLATRYEYDGSGQLLRIAAPAAGGVAASRSFAYDVNGNVVSVTDGEGRSTTFGYDLRGNQVLQRDALGGTVRRTFDARDQLLTETVYAQADPDGAGPAGPSAPLTTRYVYDAAGRNQLRFIVGAEGRVTEHRYDAFGQRTASIVYTAGTYAVTGLAADAALTEAQLVNWAGAQNRSAIQRVDIGYDGRGQMLTRTAYAEVDAQGVGIAAGASVERFSYDRAGLLLQSISATGGASQFVYDGLGRVLASTDALGRTTVTQYDDAGGRTTVRLATGLVRTSAFDAGGRLLSVTESNASGVVLGTTRYFHDAVGRLRMTEDPTGVRSWMLYDDAGRKTAEVASNGRMTEYSYDRADRLTRTVVWGNAVSAAGLEYLSAAGSSATAASVRPEESASDQAVWREYDAAGRLVRVAEQTGGNARAAVTETHYDAASRVLGTVRYANTVAADGTPGSASPGAVPLPTASAQDRTTRNFHDAEGRLAATLDAEGYLTVFRYTGAGQLSERIGYATRTDPARWATGTLAQLMPAASAQDVRELTLYDLKGRVAATLDAEGYLTEFVRDADGNATRSIRYANRVTAAAGAGSSIASIRPAASPADRVTQRAWDALGQLTQETSPEGVVTQFAYDGGGRLVSRTLAVGSTEVRSLLARYDVQGRLLAELSAEGAALLTGGQSQAEVDAVWAGHATWHAWDAAGRRISSTDAVGNRTWYFHNAEGALTHTVNALGEVQETRYDTRGRVIMERAYAGRISTAGLAGGLVTGVLLDALAAIADDALDSTKTISYTRDSRVYTETDALGAVTARGYNAFGEETAIAISGAGVEVTEAYTVDRRGLRTATARDSTGLNAVTTAQYDAFGRLVRSVDANGNVREQDYDRLGRVVTVRDPLHAARTTSYDAFGRVLRQTDALGNATSYAYDAAARTMTVTTAEGIVTTTTSTRHGQVQSIADGKGQLTSHSYDRDGRLVATTTALTTSTNSYDAAGRLVETRDAAGTRVVYAYDAANRVLTRRVDPAGLDLTTTWRYDARGQRVSVTDANGTVTATEYDRKGQVLKQTVDPGGLALQTVYSYDARGNTLTVTTPGGTVTRYAYDALGRRVQERVDPAGLDLRRSWTYDGNGNVLAATDALGNVTRHVYDASDRLVFTVAPLGYVRRNDHDAAGRIVKVTSYAAPIATGTLGAAPTVAAVAQLVVGGAQDAIEHRVLDRDGRLAATVDGTGGVVRYLYDANGNVASRTAYANRITLSAWLAGSMPVPVANPALDETVHTFYDALNRPTWTIDGVGAVVRLGYDGNGKLVLRTAYATAVPGTALTEPAIAAAVAGVANAAKDATERHTYDAAGRLAWTVDGTGAVRQNVHDRNGNVVRKVEYATPIAAGASAPSVGSSASDRSTAFAYDAADRLVLSVDALGGVSEQVLDANGNVVRRTAYAQPVAGLPPLGTRDTAPAIRQALSPDAAADRSTRYGYDAAGRLILSIDAVGAATETQYDAAGRVIAVTARANLVDTGGLGDTASLEALRTRVIFNPGSDRRTTHAYDAAGRLVYTVQAVGFASEALGAVQASEYDGVGRLTRSIRYAAPIAWSAAGGVASIAAALRPDANADQSDTRVYDAAGRVLSSTDARGGTEGYSYDGLGRKTRFVNRNGAAWTYTYDAAGRQVLETSPGVLLWTTGRDAQGRLTGVYRGGAPVATRLGYDALGNLTSRTEAVGHPEERTTRYEYDAVGRQVRVVHPVVAFYNATTDTVGNALLETRTFYDTLGNAVAGRDIGYAVSQKTYDRLGRVTHEIDALGYVTSYARNSFGEVVGLTRHAAATGLVAPALTQASQAVTAAQVDAVVNAAGFDRSRDRTLSTSYDRAGRVSEAAESAAYVYDSSAAAGAQVETAGRRTRNSYDAFGQLVQAQTLRNARTDTWATTTYYHDSAGRQVASIDALGYLTLRSYDAHGNLTELREQATAVAPGWSVAGYVVPAADPDDRVTSYAYDLLNRRIRETRVGIEFSAGADGNSTRGDAVTTFGYDAVGNQTRVTDALGGVTSTSYDALGRVVSVAGPTRLAGGVSTTPLTVYKRDAYGNALVTIEFGDNTGSPDLLYARAQDRQTVARYDSFSRQAEVRNAGDVTESTAYDAYGHVAKKWQDVTANGAVVGTLYEINTYDSVGRLVATRTPATTAVFGSGAITQLTQTQAGSVTTSFDYNAFGELTRKTSGGVLQEYFEYDAVGRVWRTNAGDGVDRIKLYDLQGNQTAELRSAGAAWGNVDLKTIASAAAADGHAGVRRTDTRYDLLGRVTTTLEAVREEQQGGVTALRQWTSGSVNLSAGISTNADGHLVPKGNNGVTLSWTSLASLGSGDIKVYLEYRPYEVVVGEAGPVWKVSSALHHHTSRILEGGAAAAGASLEWAEDQFETLSRPEGPAALLGVERITRMVVYKKNSGGYWEAVIDQAPGNGAKELRIAAPADPRTGLTLQIRTAGAAGDDGWWTAPVSPFGDQYRYDAAGLTAGSYEYRVTVYPLDAAPRTIGSGALTVAQPGLGVIATPLYFGTSGVPAGSLGWDSPVQGTTQAFNVRSRGAAGAWSALPIRRALEPKNFVDTSVLAAGTYDFELLWGVDGHQEPNAHMTGVLTVDAAGQYSCSLTTVAGAAAISTTNGSTVTQSAWWNGDTRSLRPTVHQKTDRWGNVVQVSDPRSAAWLTHYRYNANNQLVQQTKPDLAGATSASSPVTSLYYDKLGRQVAVKDARGSVNGQAFDAAGLLVQERAADGGFVEHSYDVFGRKVSTRDAKGHTVWFTYDKLDRMLSMRRGTAVVYVVDGTNTLLNAGIGILTDRWTYDSLGRKLTQTNGENQTVSYTYDLRGNLLTTTQPMGQVLRSAYDTQGRKIAEVDANGKASTWTFDYFGQLRSRVDLGGALYQYTYDAARQLIAQNNGWGQSISYSYDTAGQQTSIRDWATGKATDYTYDLSGRRVRERVVQGGLTYQDNRLAYDAQGNLRDVADGRVHIGMEYDAVGNRKRIVTAVNYQGVSGEVGYGSDRYFQYDAMNRQTVVDAVDAAGNLGTQGHRITYDLNGNRASDTYWGKRVVPNAPIITGYNEDGRVVYTTLPWTYSTGEGLLTEEYRYDLLNRLQSVTRDGTQIDVRFYDHADRVMHSGPTNLPTEYTRLINEGLPPSQTNGMEIRTNRYDANGRLVHQILTKSDGTARSDITWDNTPESYGGQTPDGYDPAGNAVGYVVQSAGGEVTKYATAFRHFDGYQAGTTTATSSVRGTGTTTQSYDANGFLVGVTDSRQPRNNRKFVNDSGGRTLYVEQDGQIQRQLIANGEVLGLYGVGVDPASGNVNPKFVDNVDFDFGYARITASYPTPSPGAYQVRPGDTLQTIAQGAYGDSALWYRIAEANGLGSTRDLKVGQTLTIPNRIGTVGNNNTTFKPYDPSKIQGDMTPALPMPKGADGCGGVGQLLMVIVAIVVTIYTAGAMAGVLGSTGGATTFSAGMAAMAGGSAGGVTIGVATGATVFTSGAAVSVASAAIGAAAGSVASQLVGVGAGVVEKFNWKNVALSAIGGGIGSYLGGAGFLKGAPPTAAAIGRAVVGNVATQGIAVAVGLQKKFDWRGVAASAVGAGVGQVVGEALGLTPKGIEGMGAGELFGKRLMTGLAAGAVAAVARGGKVAIQQVAVDAFGNALGQSIAEQASGTSNRTMGAGSAPVAENSTEYGGGLKLSNGLYDSWAPKFNVPDPLVRPAWDLYADGTPKLSAYQGMFDDDVAVSMPVEDRRPYVVERPLPPLAPIPRRPTTEASFGKYYVGQLAQTFEGVYSDLDRMAEDPASSSGMRFAAAVVRNPAKWFGDAVTGTGALVTYGLDSQFRSQVNTGIGNFFSNDPIGTSTAAITRYWGEHSGLEITRDAFNLAAGGLIGTPMAKGSGLVLKEATSVIGEAGETALRWTQRMSEYHLEWTRPTPRGFFSFAGAVDPTPLIPVVRNLRAEVTALLPEGFELARISRGGAAVLRYGDDYYSVPKGQYSLIPELRMMDTMGDVFTRRVQTIADRFNPLTDLTEAQALRLRVTPEGWLKDKFMGAYKGSYVDKQFGRELPYISGGSDYAKMAVGPDVVRVSGTGLSYEITQLTPSLNAIYSHTRKYPSELLRYVTYR